MDVGYEKQEQRLVASQVRMVRGREGRRRRRERGERGVMTIGREKAGVADKKKSRGGCHRMALSQVLLRLTPV